MILYVAADIMSNTIGVWHSLVVRLVRDQEAAGSNPVTPTKQKAGLVPASGHCQSLFQAGDRLFFRKKGEKAE